MTYIRENLFYLLKFKLSFQYKCSVSNNRSRKKNKNCLLPALRIKLGFTLRHFAVAQKL